MDKELIACSCGCGKVEEAVTYAGGYVLVAWGCKESIDANYQEWLKKNGLK